MFTRHLTMKLKENTASEFSAVLESQVIPVLQKQRGFRDEIVLFSPGTLQIVAISFWDTKEDVDSYSRIEYANVLGALSPLIDGNPRVETFEVANSTVPKIAAKGA